MKCTVGKGIFNTKRGLLQHCERLGDFTHKLLYAYLTELHLGNMQLAGESEKNFKKK